MENIYILPLSDQSATLENVGGKGMSLAKLITAGIPVPDGFHVTTGAYRLFIETNGIGPGIQALLCGADPADTEYLELISKQIHKMFDDGEIPPELERAVTAACRSMNHTPAAVRSSATAEDLPGASFAGQQDTYLNIQGEQEILAAIKRCWASLWNARAISYRLLHDIDQKRVALAVVVQKLVFSDASGVMFTANPVNGRRSEIVINAAWGLGEAVVSSLVNPDTAVVDKTGGKILSLDIADKQVMTVRTKGGSMEQPVADSIRNKPALTNAQMISLAGLGRRIEAYYGIPMDVEWALEKGTFYIVQARPITVLPPDWTPPETGVYYTKGSLAEHLPSPVSPLFATMGVEHANLAAKALWQHMFGSSVPKLWPGHGAYTVINGYVYLSCVYKPFLLMVKSLSPRSLREGMMGSIPRYEAAQKRFAAEVERREQVRPETCTAGELLVQAVHLFDAASSYFTAIQLCLPAAMTSETCLRRIYQKKAGRAGVQELSVCLLGFDTAALKTEKSLYQIAEWIKQYPALAAYITQASAGAIEADLKQPAPPAEIDPAVWQAWKDRIQEHLYVYGRTCYEYDFAVTTPTEEYLPALESIKAFVSGVTISPFVRQMKAVQKRDEAEMMIKTHLKGPHKWLFPRLLQWAQAAGAMREDAIFHMGMAHPLLRRMLRAMAGRLMAGGAIAQPEDIYWLENQELETLVEKLDQGMPLPDMNAVIEPRREEAEHSRRLVSPDTLSNKSLSNKSKSSAGKRTSIQKDGTLMLSGIGTSAGIVTGPACVLCGPADFAQFKPGDVLIAVTTTPAWTPLFAFAGAVVTDIGGPLSHSSIVAREYGIPAVMAVHSATRSIRSGQMVTVDGGEGTVTLHE